MKTLKKKPIQVYLEPQQDNVLAVLAKRRGISKAEIIRISLEKFFKEIPLEEDPAMGLIGLGRSKKGDLSVHHDQYIARYAKSKRK